MTKYLAILLFAALALAVRADTGTNPPSADLALIPENVSGLELLKATLLWQQNVTVRTGGGARDNVLDSPTNAQARAFVSGGLDYSLARLPLDGWGLNVFLTGDSLRYFQPNPASLQ